MHRLAVSSNSGTAVSSGEFPVSSKKAANSLETGNLKLETAPSLETASSLETQYIPGATPWFGLRLRCGNSLIGARRSVWTTTQLAKGKHYGKNSEVPRLLKPGEQRKKNEIYHFLVFDEDMVPAHKNKLMKYFWPDECATASLWISKQVKSKWAQPDLKEALEICTLIDSHWQNYSEERQAALAETACTASVWPELSNSEQALRKGPSLAEQEKRCAILEKTSGSFQRLKLLMDAWCGFWFWPLDKVDELPNRESFLAAAGLLLGHQAPHKATWPLLSVRLGFQVEVLIKAAEEEVPNTEILADVVSWLGVSCGLAAEQNFHHWELVFPEVLGAVSSGQFPVSSGQFPVSSNCGGSAGSLETGNSKLETKPKGFDLVLGNPPWLKVSWNDAVVLNEFDVTLGVKESKSAGYNKARLPLLQDIDNRRFYSDAFCQGQGVVTFLNSHHEYPVLAGIQTNLYKNFIVRAWAILAEKGIGGLLHPEGPYDDSRGGKFRTAYYQRLKGHFQHINELQLFADVGHSVRYSINIFIGVPGKISFYHIANLVHPKTVSGCLSHRDKHTPVPGIKDDQGNWNTKPHCHRVINITENELSLFAGLLEEDGVAPIEARLPQIHSMKIFGIIRKINQTPQRLKNFKGHYFATEMLHEANAQRDGYITRQDKPSFHPENSEE